MNVFLVGRGGGLSRLMGFRRAREFGGQADTQPMLSVFGNEARSISAQSKSSSLSLGEITDTSGWLLLQEQQF